MWLDISVSQSIHVQDVVPCAVTWMKRWPSTGEAQLHHKTCLLLVCVVPVSVGSPCMDHLEKYLFSHLNSSWNYFSVNYCRKIWFFLHCYIWLNIKNSVGNRQVAGRHMAIAVIREEMSPLWLIHLTYHLEGVRGKKKKSCFNSQAG